MSSVPRAILNRSNLPAEATNRPKPRAPNSSAGGILKRSVRGRKE